jgi:hypothetical protein
MRHFAVAAGIALALGPVAAPPVAAGPAVDALSSCLVMNTSGADRVLLMRWVLFAFSAHPQAGQSVTVDPAQLAVIDQDLATLFMALLTERCQNETRAAFQAEGGAAFEGAFAILGQVAAQELSLAPEVNATMTGFLKYVDEAKLTAVLQ